MRVLHVQIPGQRRTRVPTRRTQRLQSSLGEREDLIDARICAWVAAVWNRYGDTGVRVFGDAASGHIAVPIGSVVAS
jgi:predicted RNase H-like nuclease